MQKTGSEPPPRSGMNAQADAGAEIRARIAAFPEELNPESLQAIQLLLAGDSADPIA